ncbi:hypothetical protein U1Q18_012632 [Sarracenia purpurea var. burkii]
MVAPSLLGVHTCENGSVTGHSLGNGASVASNRHYLKCEEVRVSDLENRMFERRISARIQKMTNLKAIHLHSRKESSDHIEEKVVRKKAKVHENGYMNPPDVGPGVVDDSKCSKGKEMVLGSNESRDSANAEGGQRANGSANAEGCQGALNGIVLTELAVSGVGGEKSAYALVTETLRTFNKHYLHLVQEEEKRAEANRKTIEGSNSKKGNAPADDTKRSSKRPDLKAISKASQFVIVNDFACVMFLEMMETNAVLYPNKQIGPIPGVDVGHQFFSRAEMVAVGFHSHWLNGIDYIGKSRKTAGKDYSDYTLPLAVAIVLSGQYEDDLDNCEDVVYTGQGGNDLLGNKRQIQDQVMLRGNLALKNCMEQSVPVRVVRGHQSVNSYVGKVYTYDGLYKVVNYWAEKGVSGFTVFKFRLKRLAGQPLLTTNQVQFSRGRIPNSISEIRGLVCEDITWGQEDIPIPATNLVDDPPVAPTGFTYRKSILVAKNVKLPSNAPGCNCKGTCVDPKSCACARLNGSDFPYVHRDGGSWLNERTIPYVDKSHGFGVYPRLVKVFRTPKKGWGVRSWDYIPSGAPVCEYIGFLMKSDDIDITCENTYVFDIDCLQTMKGLDGRERRLRDVSIPAYLEKSDDQKSESVPEFCIDAVSSGNVARFINHSCQPNLFVQCVLSSHHDIKLARIVLFAADNIPPLKELTYDYGYVLDSVLGPDGKIRRMACYCGAEDCRKRLF